jgi:hypothetical protein
LAHAYFAASDLVPEDKLSDLLAEVDQIMRIIGAIIVSARKPAI